MTKERLKLLQALRDEYYNSGDNVSYYAIDLVIERGLALPNEDQQKTIERLLKAKAAYDNTQEG